MRHRKENNCIPNNPEAMSWMMFFLDFAVRGVLVSGAAALAVWQLRGRWRTVASAFALWALLVLPLAQVLPRWEITLPGAADAVSAMSDAARDWRLPVAVWGVGALLVAARLVPAWLRLREWQAVSRPAEEPVLQDALRQAADTLGLRALPELRLMPHRTMPVACGWRRPLVFLPEEALEWRPEQLEMVLLHELAHVKRQDPGMQMLGHMACALHWFNPLVWMLHRTWLREREMATDALVLSTGVPPKGYARHLVEVAEKFRAGLPAVLPAAAMAGPGLEKRVHHILSFAPGSMRPSRTVAVLLILSACAAVSALATMLPRPLPHSIFITPAMEQDAKQRLEAEPFPEESR